MSQVSILKGVYSDAAANYRPSYPINLEPVIVENGLSQGQLRPSGGLTLMGTGPGADRGGYVWNGTHYRVMGSKLVRVDPDGTIVVLGARNIGGITPVRFDCSFDLMSIAAGGTLYYFDGVAISSVTDPDLGLVTDAMWIDGYFMTTDGRALVVTELSDPYSVNPLKYGSSEADPDPVLALLKVRNEAYAVNRNTIENFQNIGGDGFPFRRNPGGLIPKGAAGTHAWSYFLDSFAFVGSAQNEALSVYLAGYGDVVSISTPEIDRELAALTDAEAAAIEVEAITRDDEQRLLIHLPTKTLVYSSNATLMAKAPVWHILAGGVEFDAAYPARHFTLSAGQWVGGADDGRVGSLDDSVASHFGDDAGWRFDTVFLFNAGKGAILRTVELFGLPGRGPFGLDPTTFMSVTKDGQTWSQERAISMGAFGERAKRLQWRPKVRFATFAGLRFRGATAALAAFSRLEVDAEPLSV